MIVSYNDFLSRLRVQQISVDMKRVAFARTRLLMKHVTYSANLLITSGFILRTKRIKLWSQGCTIPSCGIFMNGVSLKIDVLASVFKQVDLRLVNHLCDTCLSSHIREMLLLMDGWSPKTPTLIQYHISFQWHKCVHSRDL